MNAAPQWSYMNMQSTTSFPPLLWSVAYFWVCTEFEEECF